MDESVSEEVSVCVFVFVGDPQSPLASGDVSHRKFFPVGGYSLQTGGSAGRWSNQVSGVVYLKRNVHEYLKPVYIF